MLLKNVTLLTILTYAFSSPLLGQNITRTLENPQDSLKKSSTQPAYRWRDSYLNKFQNDLSVSPLLKLDVKNLETNIYFTPGYNEFHVEESIEKQFQKSLPQALSFNEYSSLQNAAVRQSILRDYERLQDGNSNTSGRGLSPLLKKNPITDRLFGGKAPEFKPNGFIAVDLRIGSRFDNNPTIPLQLRRRPIFDFDQQISVNFNSLFNQGQNDFGNNLPNRQDIGKLGQTVGGLLGAGQQARDKMNILGNIDTKAAFNFENQFKLDFKNEPEDILQAVELGNISFPVRSQLIPGVDRLMGVRAGFRFGKLDVSTVIAQQNSRTESILVNGGSLSRPFELRCDMYDENRHFFLNHFFRNQYEKSLRSLPMVTSPVFITRVEVYVTNRTRTVGSMRNLVGITDLAEAEPFNANAVQVNAGVAAADNASNSLGEIIRSNEAFRKIDNTNLALESEGLIKGQDFEILRGAKRLTDREFTFHPQLGYISLLSPLRNDEILAVSYEYTYQGRSYKVGELTEDYSLRSEEDVIALKMLKSSTIRNRLTHPMWDLMMKNVYTLGQGQIEREGFQLRVIYKDDRTGMDVPNFPETPFNSTPLIEFFGLDKLNYNLDRQKDGNFDYVEGITINELQGFLIFPQLEPFGKTLNEKLEGNPALQDKYVFQELYDRTLTDAQQVNLKNKFFLTGSVQSSGRDISLPLGATPGSVRVYSGGSELQQGTDYDVDGQMGVLRIKNPAILASGRAIRIDYERPDLFQAQLRRLFGIRMDYNVLPWFRIGGTFMDLRENTPGFLTRTAIGNEPVDNTLWGLDLNLKKEGNGFTRLLDKLPGIQTKEPSSIQLSAEFAQLLPGVNNRRVDNNAMIDDFEAARTINDLTRQPNRWRLGSTPDKFRAPEDPVYGYNFKRAKISAYSVDASTYLSGGFGLNVGSIIPPEISAAASANVFERGFVIQEIFVGRSQPAFGLQLASSILDISYFPHERGMYNYNPRLNNRGLLPNPKENFGAVMRGITFDPDFDNSNVEFLEFWLLNPFPPSGAGPSDRYTVRDGIFNRANTTGGKLVFHLGDISEDVIPDSRYNFENGIPTGDSLGTQAATTFWGQAPRTQFVTDAFDNNENARFDQDVGLEGLKNSREREFPHIKKFLEDINVDPDVQEEIENDPSADDFRFFLDSTFTNSDFIVKRYKDYLGMENNSPPINNLEQLTTANSIQADKEDINEDNTINDLESYHSYEFDLNPSNMRVGDNPFIIDKVVADEGRAEWYLFRVPIRKPTRSEGGITGFKSIRFMRMLLTEWEQPVVLRFAALQLVANQYRTYTFDLNQDNTFEAPETYDADFRVTTVSVEENGCTDTGNCNVKDGTTPYVVPPGFRRDRDLSQQFFREFNEQSVSMSVTNLRDGDKRGIFKNTKLDLNMYKRIKMFVHMENSLNQDMGGAFLRFGTDLNSNYYEIELTNLKHTPVASSALPEVVWPEENEFDFALDDLRNLKIRRNRNLGQDSVAFDRRYTEELIITGTNYMGVQVERTYRLTVLGNPDFSNTLVWMVGQSNPKESNGIGRPETFTIWVNELRANGFDQTSGEAAIISADVKLADIGTLSISGNRSTFGFGGVQSSISARAREQSQGFGIATSLDLDKFFPQKWGLSIPFFLSFDQQLIKPHFDPLDPDIVLERSLEKFDDPAEREAYRNLVLDQTTNRGFNFANVRKIKTNPNAKAHFYDIENFTFSYARNSLNRSNILLSEFRSEQQKGALTYDFSPKSVLWEPFKDSKSLEKPALTLIKDFNLSLLPNLISFKTDFDRNFIKTQYRNPELGTEGVSPNFIKYFNLNRIYDVQWDFAKSILFSYSAQMRALVDEPFGDIDETSRSELWRNLRSFGRANYFKQSLQLTYQIPLDRIYLLDWITADARANTDYIFRANAYDFDLQTGITDSEDRIFGNFLENSRELAVQGSVDLVKLYNKIKYLRLANAPAKPKERFTRAPGSEEEIELATSELMKKFTRLLMTVRGINFNFSRVEGTLLPGFLPSPNLFGVASGSRAPGLDFAMFGSQRRDIHTFAAEQGWLSNSRDRNDPFTQNIETKFDFSTNLEPWTGFRMQIRANYSRGDSYQEIYKPNGNDVFTSQNPFRNGTFSMSFWSFRTVFKRMENDPETNYRYEVFENMKDYRYEVVEKLQQIQGGEVGGYHPNSQDVLIPAFFAAYTGGTVDKLFEKAEKRGNPTFNPFLRFPMPNWRIDYGGLEKLPVFKKMFSSLTLNHSYTSTYNVGNFTSSLLYGSDLVNLSIRNYQLGDELGTFGPSINDISYFLPVFIMSSINMEERYSPLIGVNFAFKNQISGRFQYNKERRASLNLSNTQVAEFNSNDLVFGFGFKKNNVKLPFRGRDGNNVVLKNDVNFRFDLTLKDMKLLQRRLDEQYANSTDPLFGEVIPIQGNYNFQIRPQIQYQFNKKLSMSFYFEHFVNTPFTSLSFAQSQTVGGINMRFNLAD